MPQSASKEAMLKRLRVERKRLEDNLARLTPQQMTQPGVMGGQSVKDILAHLADWESRMPRWMAAARRGERVVFPEERLAGQVDLFNERIYAAHRDQPLEQVLAYSRAEHARFMQMVEEMPEDEMLERGRYAFTGKGAVYGWLAAYANHDLWAKTKIRKWLRSAEGQ